MLESCYRDFTLGLRSLRRNPVFAITAILTLAVGIGANTVVFTLLYGLLLRSLPVQDPAALSASGSPAPQSTQAAQVRFRIKCSYNSAVTRSRSTDISAWGNRPVAMDMDDGTPRMLGAAFVSGNGFEVLGMNAYSGPARDTCG